MRSRLGLERLSRFWSQFSGTRTTRFGRAFRRWGLAVLLAAILGGVGWWTYAAVQSQAEEAVREDLGTILRADVAALRHWLREQQTLTAVLASDPQVREAAAALARLRAAGDGTREGLVRSPHAATLRAQLNPALREQGYLGYAVVDRADGQVLAAWQDGMVGMPLSLMTGEELDRRRGAEAAFVTPPFLPRSLPPGCPPELAGQPAMIAAAPVRDGAGKVVAYLGFRIDPRDEFARILEVGRFGNSGETYAFNRDGLLVSPSRFEPQLRELGLLPDGAGSLLGLELRDPGADLTRGEPAPGGRYRRPLTRMAAEATQGRSGSDVAGYRDYRGAEVVGAWTWLDEYGFGVATEVDRGEAYAPLYLLRRVFGLLFALLLLSGALHVVGSLVLEQVRRKARRAARAAEQLGQYTLEEKIGEGGMGEVYRARHALLRRPTAVKLLRPGEGGAKAVAQFEREVQLTAQLRHPNTVAIYDYGHTTDGVFYYAMELLAGLTLEELVGRFGPQPEGRVIHILRQVCGSLEEAHAAGLIHRDVKPSNIFLCRQGGLCDLVKVLDFGLVLDRTESSPNSTAANAILGTPLFMAPEAITAPARADARRDIYAVGAVGYYLLTGRYVFDGETIGEIFRKHLNVAPTPPSEVLGRAVDPDLERVLLRCLAKDPADRPGSAAELDEGLAACAAAGSWGRREAQAWWNARPDILEGGPPGGPGSTEGHVLNVTVPFREDEDSGG